MAIVNSEYQLMFSFTCTSDTSGIVVNHYSIANLFSPCIIITNKIYFVQNCQLPHCWCHIINVKMALCSVLCHYIKIRCQEENQVQLGPEVRRGNIKEHKAIPLQAWTGPEGSRRLRLPDFKTIGT
jgi:hypothetical protein